MGSHREDLVLPHEALAHGDVDPLSAPLQSGEQLRQQRLVLGVHHENARRGQIGEEFRHVLQRVVGGDDETVDSSPQHFLLCLLRGLPRVAQLAVETLLEHVDELGVSQRRSVLVDHRETRRGVMKLRRDVDGAR